MPKYRVNEGCRWYSAQAGDIVEVSRLEATGWVPRVLTPVEGAEDAGTHADVPKSEDRKAPKTKRRRNPEPLGDPEE